MSTSRRKQLLAERLGSFVQKYARKAQKGVEPNDRNYSGEIEEAMKRLSPEELSELISGESDESLSVVKKKRTKSDSFIDEIKRNR